MTNANLRRAPRRKGLGTVEVCCIVGGVVIALFLLWNSFTGALRGRMNSTATGVGDPAKLVKVAAGGK